MVISSALAHLVMTQHIPLRPIENTTLFDGQRPGPASRDLMAVGDSFFLPLDKPAASHLSPFPLALPKLLKRRSISGPLEMTTRSSLILRDRIW